MNLDKLYRNISLFLTWFWSLALLPISVFSFMAVVATIMMSDNNQINGFFLGLFIANIFLFLAIPVVTLISILLSVSLRKQEKHLLSIRIQLLPIANAIFAFGLLLVMSKLL